MNIFSEMRQKGQLTDVTIVVRDGIEFQAHKPLLSGRSPFFRAMFTCDFKEQQQAYIMLPKIHPDIMAEILNFIYTKKATISVDNVQDLVVEADKLMIPAMVEACLEFLHNSLDKDNCFEIMRFARWYNFEKLGAYSRHYVCQHFEDIYEKSQSFLELGVDDLDAVLRDDCLNISHEEAVWRALLTWTNHDPVDRLQHFPRTIRCVRLCLLPRTYFLNNIYKHPQVKNCKEIEALMHQVFKLHYELRISEFPSAFEEVAKAGPQIWTPRLPSQFLLAIGGWAVGSPTNEIESYDNRADRWVPVISSGEVTFGPRAYHGAVVMQDELFVIGGFDGTEYYNSTRVFNIITRSWTEKSSMNCRRCYVSVAQLNGYIYAMGGFDGHLRMNTVERYDVAANQWSYVAPMHVQRSDAHAAVLEGKIYICGGFNGHECMSSVEYFDPANNTWTLIEPMSTPRSGVGLAVHKDLGLVAIGGFSGTTRLRTSERFSPRINRWLPIAIMNSPRSNFAVEVLEDSIVVVGGFNGLETIPSVEIYIVEHNIWYPLADMSISRSALYACVLNRTAANTSHLGAYCYDHRANLFEDKIKEKQDALRNRKRGLAPDSGEASPSSAIVNQQQHDRPNTPLPPRSFVASNEIAPAPAWPLGHGRGVTEHRHRQPPRPDGARGHKILRRG